MCALPPRARAGLAPPRPPHGRAQPASRPNVARGRRSRAGGREHLRLARPTPQLRPDAARCPAAAFLPPRTAARREMSRPSSLLSLPSLAFPSRDSAPHEYGPRTKYTNRLTGSVLSHFVEWSLVAPLRGACPCRPSRHRACRGEGLNRELIRELNTRPRRQASPSTPLPEPGRRRHGR